MKEHNYYMVNVTVYSSKTCGRCTVVKTQLEKYDVSYLEKDVKGEENEANMAYIKENYGTSLPVVEAADGTAFNGLDMDKLNHILKTYGTKE